MSELKKLLGKKIKTIRKEKKLTQEQLAEMIKIETPSMSNIETGKFAPSIDTMERLSKVLNVKPYEFYYFDDVTHEEMIEKMFKSFSTNKKLTKIIYKLYESIMFEV